MLASAVAGTVFLTIRVEKLHSESFMARQNMNAPIGILLRRKKRRVLALGWSQRTEEVV